MNKKVWLLIVGLFFSIGVMNAQVKTVSGVVVSAEDGLPIIGASVELNGTSVSTMTDFNGRFLIKDVPSSVTKMTVRYVGMKKVEVAVASDMIVKMRLDSKFPYGKNAILIGYNYWYPHEEDFLDGYSVGYTCKFELSRRNNFFLETGAILAVSKGIYCRVNVPVNWGYMFNVGQSGFSVSPKVGLVLVANLRGKTDGEYWQNKGILSDQGLGCGVSLGLDMSYKHFVVSGSLIFHESKYRVNYYEEVYGRPELNVGLGYCF